MHPLQQPLSASEIHTTTTLKIKKSNNIPFHCISLVDHVAEKQEFEVEHFQTESQQVFV